MPFLVRKLLIMMIRSLPPGGQHLVSALLITPGIHVNQVEVADQDQTSGSLYANQPHGDSRGRTAGCSFMSNAQDTLIYDFIQHIIQ